MTRKTGVVVSAILGAAVLASCASTNSKEQNENDGRIFSDDKILSKEEITFPVGRGIASPSFVGQVWREDMIVQDGTYDFPQTNNIVFEPGARSAWHRHGGMVVLVTGGAGYYQEEGKKAQILREGDVLEIPAGVRHWHGAAADSWFSQVVIYELSYEGPHDDGGIVHVTDEEYANLEEEEFAGRTQKNSEFMFEKGNAFDSPNFNGRVYLSDLLGDENVASCPGLHYVVFEEGVINAWHCHEDGQVLIATDGIGLHQIPGEPVQVMYPGDTAICPPGVTHWHGAAPGSTFAHIAASAKHNANGVEWFGMISAEEMSALPTE